MTYRLIIVDDEPLARTRLKHLLDKQQTFEVVAELDSGQACLDFLKQQSADAVLLDIQMPGLNGLETAARIQLLERAPLVIFCTAYDEYALDAFGVKAIDYLLKPVRREELQRSLTRVSEWLQHNATTPPTPDAEKTRTHLAARTHMGLQLIPIEDVFYFSADQKYVNVVHAEGETLIDESLRQLEDEFGERFVRVHRSALVARNRIERLGSVEGSGHQVYLRGLRDGVSVSRRHLADVRRVMKSM